MLFSTTNIIFFLFVYTIEGLKSLCKMYVK